MSSRKGNLLVITAPSGGGKSTLIARLCKSVPSIGFSVSYTTRQPRAGEEHGREYFFVSESEFLEMRDRGEFLEWALVYGNYYATHRRVVEEILARGEDVLLDIDVQGAQQVRGLMPEAVLIYILPPSFEVLGERLKKRGLDSDEAIERRLRIAREEVKVCKDFDYCIINDNLDRATNELVCVALAERIRPDHLDTEIMQILKSFGG